MPLATDLPVLIGGLVGFGLVFALLGYLVKSWWWLVLIEILVIVAVAVVAGVWPSGYEFDTKAFITLVLIPATLALICSGLGIALRLLLHPND